MDSTFPFPDWLLTTDIEIHQEVKNENGGKDKTLIFEGKCIYDESSKQVVDANRQIITLNGSIICKGDIYPSKQIQGYVLINGSKKTIYQSRRIKDPLGNIYSTEIDLA